MIRELTFLTLAFQCALSFQGVCLDKSFLLKKHDVAISQAYFGTEKWVPFQRRLNDSEDFFRGIEDYTIGFGDTDKSFWLGLKSIHELTKNGSKLLVVMESLDGAVKWAKYDRFIVDGCEDKFKLHIGGYSGDAGDMMDFHNEMLFSTKDMDLDITPDHHCAQKYYGGWWYKNCHKANPNGKYLGEKKEYATGVNWESFSTYYTSLKTFRMFLAL